MDTLAFFWPVSRVLHQNIVQYSGCGLICTCSGSLDNQWRRIEICLDDGSIIGAAERKQWMSLSDSFQDGLVSPPVYTRPAEFNGWKVPEVLLSGNPKLIRAWQDEQAIERTRLLRPELLEEK